MKNYFKISIIVVAVSSALFSCNPENVTEGDFLLEGSGEQLRQHVGGTGSVRETL